MTKKGKDIHTAVITDELKQKMVRLQILAETKSKFEGEILDIVQNVHPKLSKRICNTNYKYICVAKCGNMLTYWVYVSVKEFKWWSSFSDIRQAVVAIKKKFAEHNQYIGSIKKY